MKNIAELFGSPDDTFHQNRLSQSLIACGVKRTDALVVELLADHKPHGMHEIERALDLRQPEVSTAITALTEYLNISYKEGDKQGRPMKIVCMKKSGLREYIDDVISQKNDEVLRITKAIEALEGVGV